MKPKTDTTKHVLVPKHSKLSEKDKKELFERYRVTLKEMPKILINDPALIGLDVKPGDIVKIIRKSPTAGEAIFYRGVIDA